MASREIAVTVPIEVRITSHDDGSTTVQWIDIDDTADSVARDVESHEEVVTGILIEVAEAAVSEALGSARRI